MLESILMFLSLCSIRDDKVESVWVRNKGRANKADILVMVCYRPLNWNEETDEMFYEQLAVV